MARPKPLRVAVVGLGRMGRQHVRAISAAPDQARLVACVESDPAVRASLAGKVSRSFESLGALLSDSTPDVLHICTPPETHGNLALMGIEHGCHVYVEKPVAGSQVELQTLLAEAAKRRLIVCPGHQLLFGPPMPQLCRLLPGVGPAVHMESYFSFRPARRRPRSDLQLIEVLPHPVYLLVRALVSAAPGSSPELSYVDVGPGATIHALVRCGGITGSLVVTLDGRPVENFLRVVGERGTITGDFVRGTIHTAFGPGSSRFGKMFAPFHTSSQLALGTAAALTRRVLQWQTSYPGLAETIAKFYSAVAASDDGPVPPSESLATVKICAMIGDNLHGARPQALRPAASAAPVILVTGGTGFLGHALVSELVERGHTVRCVSRSGPAPWKTLPGVDYQTADLSRSLPDHLLSGIRTIVHAAAATEGGWDAHQAHSIDATRNVLVAAARAGIRDVVLVSSLGVLATPRGDVAIDERTPLDPSQRETLGPYTWGKLTSEHLARDLAEAHELRLRVVRPGAIIDHQRFEPPGRLGRQVESLFVAVGHPGDRLGVIDLKTAARAIAWIALHPADAPDSVNLLALDLPTKGELVTRLRSSRPGLRVCWLPEWVVALMAWAKPSLRAVFASRRYDDRVSRRLIADAEAPQVATVIADRSRRAVSRSYSATSLSPMELQE